MKGRVFPMLGTAALFVLALAGPAFGYYTPTLSSSTSWTPTGVTGIQVGYRQLLTDDATAALTFYAPPAMQANLSEVPGTKIGFAYAGLDIAGAVAATSGPVVVANPADPAIAPLTAACTGTSTHAAVWLLHLTTNDVPIDVPVSVDPASGPEAAFASYTLRICFRSPYIPAQAGQPNGIFGADLSFDAGVFTPPASGSDLPWTGLFFPWKAGTGTINPAAAVESQSLASYPLSFRVTGKDVVSRHVVGQGRGRHVVTVHQARIVGRLTANGKGEPGGYRVCNGDASAPCLPDVVGQTNANGMFTRLLPLKRTTRFTVSQYAEAQVPGVPCNPLIPISTNPLITPTCTDVTSAAITATGGHVTVTKRATKPIRGGT